MTSDNYWRKREEAWQKEQIKDDKKRMAEIAKRFRELQDDIQKEINSQWNNFSDGERITIEEAMKRADKMDVRAFAKKARKYVKNRDFSKRANEELKLYNLTMRVNRLELLKASIGLELVVTFDELDKFFAEQLNEGAMNELRRQAGILGDEFPEKYFSKAVESVMNGSYNSNKYASFSDNLWSYQSELKSDLDKLLMRGVTQGVNPRKLAPQIAKYLTDKGRENTRFNTERLMITEMTRVQIDSQKKSYEDCDVDEYEYIAEPSACDTCKPLDGEIFKVKDMEPGKNAPNLHPMCRCSTAPHVNRESFEEDLKRRGL